jgi:hypothetical protein
MRTTPSLPPPSRKLIARVIRTPENLGADQMEVEQTPGKSALIWVPLNCLTSVVRTHAPQQQRYSIIA